MDLNRHQICSLSFYACQYRVAVFCTAIVYVLIPYGTLLFLIEQVSNLAWGKIVGGHGGLDAISSINTWIYSVATLHAIFNRRSFTTYCSVTIISTHSNWTRKQISAYAPTYPTPAVLTFVLLMHFIIVPELQQPQIPPNALVALTAYPSLQQFWIVPSLAPAMPPTSLFFPSNTPLYIKAQSFAESPIGTHFRNVLSFVISPVVSSVVILFNRFSLIVMLQADNRCNYHVHNLRQLF